MTIRIPQCVVVALLCIMMIGHSQSKSTRLRASKNGVEHQDGLMTITMEKIGEMMELQEFEVDGLRYLGTTGRTTDDTWYVRRYE